MEGAKNFKLLLNIFEAMSGPKLIFDKSEVIMIMDDTKKMNTYGELFNC
jgi:hypothetical protein